MNKTAPQAARTWTDFDTLFRTAPAADAPYCLKQLAKGQGLVSKRFTGSTGGCSGYPYNDAAQDPEIALGQLTWLVLQYSQQQRRFGLVLSTIALHPSRQPSSGSLPQGTPAPVTPASASNLPQQGREYANAPTITRICV